MSNRITLYGWRRRFVNGIVFAALLLLPFLSRAAGEIRVMTWNLEWFPGGNPEATTEEKRVQMLRAQEALKSIRPDIFLCQEVASWQAVAELTSVVPGLKSAVVSDFGPAGEGRPAQNVGIATRFPVDSGWAQRWKEIAPGGWTTNPVPRGFAFAAVELPNDVLLLIYTVHLKSNHRGKSSGDELLSDMAAREESSRLLRGHIAKMRAIYEKSYPKIAVLVGGDFNTSIIDPRFEREQTLRTFRQEGFAWGLEGQPADRQYVPVAPTYRGDPKALFDHFFALGLGAIRARTLYFRGVRDISDHMPVEVSLFLR
jgi:endonuclease/exonuclease/phosphatase family metal-dependent hydrolase